MLYTFYIQPCLLWFSFFSTISFSRAQGTALTVQDDWISPIQPDNSSVLDIGKTFTIEWTPHLASWFPLYAESIDVTNTDLWITDFFLHIYQYRVARAVNINASTSIPWQVQVDPTALAATPYWVFRFIESGYAPNETSTQISSPGVVIRNLSATVTSSTASPAPTSASADPSRVPSSAIPTSSDAVSTALTSASSNNSTESHLSTGAIAGIAAGGVIGAALMLGLGYFLAKRSKTKTRPTLESTPSYPASPWTWKDTQEKQFTMAAPSYTPQHIQRYDQAKQALQMPPQEMENTYRGRIPAELGATPYPF